MNIADIAGAGKAALRRVPEGVLTALIVLFASSGAFGLGILAGKDMGQSGDIWVERLPQEAAVFAAVEGNSVQKPAPDPKEPVPTPITAGGQYVASKNGTRYYLPWCGSAKNIKEENKVWFDSKAEAEAAGYTPATNCKGI